MVVKAPPGFQPEDADIRRQNVPPAPARLRKEQLYRSVLEFQDIDDHAIKVAQMEHDNFVDLIWHLVYQPNFRTELQKVRAIFRWMTSKNMHAMTFGEGAKPGSPEEVLLSFRQKQGTYARSFEVLCRYAGVTSSILTGYAKGLDYRPGNQFKDSNYNHSWNAVLVDGNWFLIDSHWATRYLVSEKNVAENLVYEYDDFFFLTNAEQLVYSHWSQAPEWQLLDTPLTLAQFEDMPLVKSYFFKCAMHFVSHQKGVISTTNGNLALTLGYQKPTNFSYKITFADSGDEVYQGHRLKDYALHHRGHNQSDTMLFRAPKAGAYYISFFAQLLTGEVGVKSTFTAACEYKVVADRASQDAVPLPLCSDLIWGPGFAVEQLGLTASPQEGILTTTNGQVCLEFCKSRPAYVLCKLKKNGVQDEEDLERYIRDIDFDEAVQVRIMLPSPGEYGIDVYGNDPEKDGDTYTHVCQYYVHYATLQEQSAAFYQDSPQRRATMEAFTFTTTAPPGYLGGFAGLESATATMTLNDPADLPLPPPPPPEDDLPPPPPDMLASDAQAAMPPDMAHENRYLPPSGDPNLYYQQGYMAGSVQDPNQLGAQTQYSVSAALPPDARQQQGYLSTGSGPGTATIQQQAPYRGGSTSMTTDPHQPRYLPGLLPPDQGSAEARVVSPGGAGQQQVRPYQPASVDQPGTASASLQMSFSGPGGGADRRDLSASADDQHTIIAPGDVKGVYMVPPGQREIIAPGFVRAEVYSPGQRELTAPLQREMNSPGVVHAEVYSPGQREVTAPLQREMNAPGVVRAEVYTPAQREVTAASPREAYVSGNVGLVPQTDQREATSPGPAGDARVTWTPQGVQRDILASSTPQKAVVWTPGSSSATAAPSSQGGNYDSVELKASKAPPQTLKKPSWPPAKNEAELSAAANITVAATATTPTTPTWKSATTPRTTGAPAGFQKVTYNPDVVRKPSWTPNTALDNAATTTAQKNNKPGFGGGQDTLVTSPEKVPPPVARKPTWTPRDNSASSTTSSTAVFKPSTAPVPAVWKPGSAVQKGGAADLSQADQKGYEPVTVHKAVWTPSSSAGEQREGSGLNTTATPVPAAGQKNVWTPSSEQRGTYVPGTDPKTVQVPGSVDQRNAYAPGTDQRSAYAPGTDQRSTYAPGTDQRSTYAPGTDQRSTYAPGTDQRSTYAPGTDQRSMYAPGTDQRSAYASGMDQTSTYAPGSDQRSTYAPGTDQRTTYAPGTDQRSMYATGGEPQILQGPGQRSTYAPGMDQRSTYAPGTDQRSMYAPGTEPSTLQGPGQRNRGTEGGPMETGVQRDISGMLPQQAMVTSVVIPASSRPLQVEKRSLGQAPPSAPQTFQLTAVAQEMEQAPPPTPSPAPSAPGKPMPSLQAIDQQVLMSVDDHAIQVSKSDHSSFRDLVWDLIFSKNITNEIEKVRVIFRWLASKNLKEMSFEHVEKGSPEEVLMGLKTGVTTYAMLFNIMCSYAGLHSKIISGYAKGADYIPGMKFTGGQNQHTWNAVYLYGTWCLLDAHWGARRLVGKQTSEEDFHYQLDEYFFLTDPHQLIYTHFPDDPRWQLLDRCVTLQEFESMPHMKPQFFKFGLEFMTHRSAIIHSEGGEVTIRLRYPAAKVKVGYNFTVQFENGEETYNGVKLNRYGMHDNDVEGGVATFLLRLPVTGSYILFIYAKEEGEGADKADGVYSQVCEYRVEHTTQPGMTPDPFPPCSSLTWGPTSAFRRYGLTTEQRGPVLEMREGKAQLVIAHSRPMQFMGRLRHVKIAEADLEQFIMQRKVGNSVVFDLTSPGKGEYGLEVFANDPTTDGQTLYHNAQYLLLCADDARAPPMPKMPPGYLGPQPRFTEFGMTAVTHPDPVIDLDTNTLTLVLKSKQPMRVLSSLIAVDGEEDLSTFTFAHTAEGNSSVFLVHVPRPGFFKLQLYGTPVSDTSQQIPGIYNYLLNVRQVTQPVFPLPKQYAQWKEGCFMHQPIAIVTPRGPFAAQVQKEQLPDKVTFSVDIPGANAVAVIVGAEWTHLEKSGQRTWSGQVPVGHCYGTNTRLTLNANLGGDKTNYATLLEYFL